MAHYAENISIARPSGLFGALVADIRDGLQRRRVYNRTHAELSRLSTRELDDLGISRSMISRIAYEAAYEK